MIVGYLDDIPFLSSGAIVRTFDEFSRSAEGRWQKHDLIGQKPVLEFIGPDTEEISFKMILRADLGVDPLAEVERLQGMRDEGKVFSLVIGGKTVGENFWVIKSVSHEVTYWSALGRPISAEVSVTLEEYAKNTMGGAV